MSDAVAAVAAVVIASILRFGHASALYVAVSAALVSTFLAVIHGSGGYASSKLGAGACEFRAIVRAGATVLIVLALMAYALHVDIARGFVLISVPLMTVLALAGRWLLRRRLHSLRGTGECLRRTLVVGSPDQSVDVLRRLVSQPAHGYQVVAVCAETTAVGDAEEVSGVPVLGRPAYTVDACRNHNIDAVIVASSAEMSGMNLRRLSWSLEELGVDLIVLPGIIEVTSPRLTIQPMAGMSLIHVEPPSVTTGPHRMKAVFDRVCAFAGVVVLTPVLAVLALMVRLTSDGPVLYRQQRVGLDGGTFDMLKFRSMVPGADRMIPVPTGDAGNEMLFKMRDDPRVTRIGRFMRRYSLDELPQLVNVLRGDMSLVGPRPPLPTEAKRYNNDDARRMRVKPGLTGLWQVSGRSDLSWEESIELDLRYTDNWSMMLDVQILWRTVRAVVASQGAY